MCFSLNIRQGSEMASILGKLNQIFSINKKNWLDKIKIDDLEIEKRKLELEVEGFIKEVKTIDNKKIKLFNEGKGKSMLEKRMIAEKLKELDVEGMMKYVEFDKKQKMSRALFNIINVLKRREGLSQKGLWQKLQKLTPDQLLTELSKIDIEDKDFIRNIEKIIRALETPITELEDIDKDTQKYIDLWSQVEQEEMAPEELTEKLSVEEKIKEKEII